MHQTQNRRAVCSERADHVGSVEMDNNRKKGEFLQMWSCVAALWTAPFQNSLFILVGGLRRHMATATKRLNTRLILFLQRRPRSTHLSLWHHSAASNASTRWRHRLGSKHPVQRIFFNLNPLWILPVSHCPFWTTVLLMKTSILVLGCHQASRDKPQNPVFYDQPEWTITASLVTFLGEFYF